MKLKTDCQNNKERKSLQTFECIAETIAFQQLAHCASICAGLLNVRIELRVHKRKVVGSIGKKLGKDELPLTATRRC